MEAVPRFRARHALLAALALLGLALGARADEPTGSYYPLEVGRRWRYQLNLEVEHAKQPALHDRAVAKTVRFKDREAFVVEDRVNNVVVSTETLALEGDKVLLLATKQEGGSERVYDPPRVFLDLARLDSVGAVWSWTSTDGRETFESRVAEKGPFVDSKGHFQHGVNVVITGSLKSADGKRTATQERRLWLVRGLGVFRDHAVYTPPAPQHETVTDEELDVNASSAAPSAPGGGK